MKRVEPRLLAPPSGADPAGRGKAVITQRAVLYTELERHPAWRDLIARVEGWRGQLLEDLRWGRLRRGRAFGTTDDDVRAMLYALGLVLDVPAGAKAAYDQMRQLDDEATRRREAAEARFGVGLEAE